MTDKTSFNRRRFLESSAGVATVATLGTGGALFSPQAFGQATLAFKPEKDAKLRVLRWSRFVQGDIDPYMDNVKTFTEKTGIEVRVDNEGWEDVRPKAAVAANTGAGPDIILSTNDDANLYPDKLLDVTDLCRVPRQEVRRLVSGLPGLPASRTARSGSACRSARPAR